MTSDPTDERLAKLQDELTQERTARGVAEALYLKKTTELNELRSERPQPHPAGTNSQAGSELASRLNRGIRAPLSAVVGMLDLLRESGLGKEEMGYVRSAFASSAHLGSALSNIVDLLELDSGILELNPTQFGPLIEAKKVLGTYEQAGSDCGLEVGISFASSVPEKVQGDAGRYRQVIGILLGNAVRHTDEGEISIKIDWIEVEEQACLQVEVTDTGCGISEEKLATLLEDSVLGNQPGEGDGRGLGLGLSIAQRLIRWMGGELTGRSTLGKGSCFSFTMPADVSAEESRSQPTRTGGAGEAEIDTESEEQRARILLVEDVATNRRITVRLLAHFNCKVSTAENGLEAVELVQEQDFDLVLMDCMMPIMDGFEATSMIRGLALGGHEKSLPIVALTAEVSTEGRRHCLQVGMDDFLPKPVTIKQLNEVLHTWLPPRLRPRK